MGILDRMSDLLLHRVLRRPREITPFALAQGARLQLDPRNPRRVTVTGGGVRLRGGTVIETIGSKVAFRMAAGQDITGEFSCGCQAGTGTCNVFADGDQINCIAQSGCRNCSMTIIITGAQYRFSKALLSSA